jgi:hypothetical protein
MAIEQIAPFSTCEKRRYDYIIDTDEDADQLPASCAAGSTALSCASGSVFIVNASHEWVKLGGGN